MNSFCGKELQEIGNEDHNFTLRRLTTVSSTVQLSYVYESVLQRFISCCYKKMISNKCPIFDKQIVVVFLKSIRAENCFEPP